MPVPERTLCTICSTGICLGYYIIKLAIRTLMVWMRGSLFSESNDPLWNQKLETDRKLHKKVPLASPTFSARVTRIGGRIYAGGAKDPHAARVSRKGATAGDGKSRACPQAGLPTIRYGRRTGTTRKLCGAFNTAHTELRSSSYSSSIQTDREIDRVFRAPQEGTFLSFSGGWTHES